MSRGYVLTPVELIPFENSRIDWELFRAQKATLFALTLKMGASLLHEENPHVRKTFDRLEGLLEFLDYFQDQAATVYDQSKVFGEQDDEEDDDDEETDASI